MLYDQTSYIYFFRSRDIAADVPSTRILALKSLLDDAFHRRARQVHGYGRNNQ